MKFFLLFFVGICSSLSPPSSLKKYIVTLQGIYSLQDLENHLKSLQTTFLSSSSPSSSSSSSLPYQITSIYSNLFPLSNPSNNFKFPHYTIEIESSNLSQLRERSDVYLVEEDLLLSINDCITQENPDWGLSRINQRGSFQYNSYAYQTNYSGSGVNIYIVGE